MAAKTSAVGSAGWIASEKENVLQLLQQEQEEMIYPAQHEMEWLNEHMTEIFSRSHFNVTDVFKTPGKLRGKTPRTARKHNALEPRIPLSDVFSSHQPPTSATKQSPPKAPAFTIAVDIEPKINVIHKSQADSGYHGSSQDEMEMDEVGQEPIQGEPLQNGDQQYTQTEKRRTTEGSFHSAKEEQTTKVSALVVLNHTLDPVEEATKAVEEQPDTEKPVLNQQDFDDIGSPSDESTPDRPLVRKSSLNFASLPAREPLKNTVDINHVQRSSIQPSKSTLSRNVQDVEMSDDENIEILGHDDSEVESKPPRHYRSTQRLNEQIEMLGKAPPARTSKSIPPAAALAASNLRRSEAVVKNDKALKEAVDDDDEWIKPLKSPDRPILTKSYTPDDMEGVADDDSQAELDLRAPELIAHEERMRSPVYRSPSAVRPGFGHTKSHSTATLVSPSKAGMGPPPSPSKSISVSNPAIPTTTPQGSPKRMLDGTLTASKSKLHSIMKTAKGLFTSSAGVSAGAKMETLSPRALGMAADNMPGHYPNLNSVLQNKPLPASPPKESRKTRSSTEREKEDKRRERDVKAMQKMDGQLEKAREKEKQKIKEAQLQASLVKQLPQLKSPSRAAEEWQAHDVSDMPPPNPQMQGSRTARPIRPIHNTMAKPKPAPVAIRVGTLSQRMPVTSRNLASNLQETLPTEPKRPGLAKKTSSASIQSTTSTMPFKTSVNAVPAKPRALLAAERKKEQDEREAQRKLEQKREMERRRIAQQEEAKRQELRQRAEAERKERERVAVEQAKRQAQQQAIERKRLENIRKADQQRTERADEVSAVRPPSRLGSTAPLGRSIVGHPLPTNPAKPAKRPLEEEAGAGWGLQSKAAAPQNDAKRRKTEEEHSPPRPTMSSAPIRQSNLGKKASIFNHNMYAPAQQPQPHLGQFPPPPPKPAHPSAMAQYGNGARIPFAEANPPQHANKTSASAYQQRTLQLIRSSPQFPNGEAISLPEIPTDSEDEDSEDEGNAFPIPDWATPGHLTEQLVRQEGIDGDAVFGPIAPLKMEEIFAKGNKDRLKRMRERTSSANWAMSGDGLTLEEVRVDREMRDRMRIEGGWRYGPS